MMDRFRLKTESFKRERKELTEPGFLVSLTKTRLIIIYIAACILEIVFLSLIVRYIIGLMIGCLLLFGWPVVVFYFFSVQKRAVDKFMEEIRAKRIRSLQASGPEYNRPGEYDGFRIDIMNN